MIIRSEQMEVFESAAEDDFVQRIGVHLRENYANSLVRLIDKESVVKELDKETLDKLVRHSIARARIYELSFESTISAFTAIMFDVAPNFDRHSMSKLCLKDESIEPNSRLNELLKILTDEHWEKMRADYDVNAWQPGAENTESSEKIEEKEVSKPSDFAETVMNIGNVEKPIKSAEVKQPDFDQTVMNIDTPKRPEILEKPDNFDFLDTVLNIDTNKE